MIISSLNSANGSSADLDLKRGFDVFFVRHPGVVVTVQPEKRMARACILGVVLRKLSHQYKPSPIVLLEVDEGPKVGLYSAFLVGPFLKILCIVEVLSANNHQLS